MEGEFNVRGKRFLITGGNKGLGLETVRYKKNIQIIESDQIMNLILGG